MKSVGLNASILYGGHLYHKNRKLFIQLVIKPPLYHDSSLLAILSPLDYDTD